MVREGLARRDIAPTHRPLPSVHFTDTAIQKTNHMASFTLFHPPEFSLRCHIVVCSFNLDFFFFFFYSSRLCDELVYRKNLPLKTTFFFAC